jgi:hypothetical protein
MTYNYRVNTTTATIPMPEDVRTLYLPSPLKLPIFRSGTKTDNRTRKEKQQHKHEANLRELRSLEDEDFMDLESPVREYRRSDRYVPRFDAKTARCWWEWIEFDTNENGEPVNDVDQIRADAWNALEAENEKRAEKQRIWWKTQ